MAGTIPSATADDRAGQALSWRGPGPGRPDLPIPPARQPLLHKGLMRKRWRYVGFYGEEIMLCAGVVRIGISNHTFWSVWDRVEGKVWEHTRLRPGGPEVVLDGPVVEIRTGNVRAALRFGESEPIEVVSPSGRGWGWTRKRAGVPVTGRVVLDGETHQVEGFGVDDESAGYHQRNVEWSWSAGIGQSVDGRALGWNLTEGINDSVTSSERAIWIDGVPHEPAPVEFEGLDAVRSEGGEGNPGTGLRFQFGEAERRRHDNFWLVRSDYVHRFGTFTGTLDGIELADGAGVMEEHKVVW
ncbi:MAG: DUF2804 family protein [Solirubrobacterales bacterium]|nr:DUF2804 family protein [Solirubrobacterales bacterium]OJU95653.1 MAG: hypothetical protein BGO23_08570 [Solirubrobacterales bacterium 67-14]